jgi:predicted NodU family carbamoyl transferase
LAGIRCTDIKAQNMIVLGLNAFHGDAAVAALAGGKLVAGVEEERFTRVKHWAGFPALRWETARSWAWGR